MNTDDKLKILVVDDDFQLIELISDIFKDYSVSTATSGEEALTIFADNDFTLVLLDVSMPEMDGYQVCSRIKETEKGAKTPVLFLSGKKGVDDIVKGYDSGGLDYITKPFEHQVLYNKVKHELNRCQQRFEFEQSLESVTHAMLSVQGDNSKAYAISRFMQKSFSCKDVNSLCDQFFSVTKGFGTRATLYVHTDQNTVFISDDGFEHEMSNRVLDTLRHQDRIYHFGKGRAVFNWASASLLVDKLQDDVDNLALLMDGFEAGLRTIEAIEHFHDILDKYRKQNHQLNTQVAGVVEDLISSTHTELANMGATAMLTIDQEDKLTKISDDHLDKVDALFQENLKLDEEFSKAITEIRSVEEDNSIIEEDDGIAFF